MRNQPEINKVRTNEINKLTAIRFTYVKWTKWTYIRTYLPTNIQTYERTYCIQIRITGLRNSVSCYRNMLSHWSLWCYTYCSYASQGGLGCSHYPSPRYPLPFPIAARRWLCGHIGRPSARRSLHPTTATQKKTVHRCRSYIHCKQLSHYWRCKTASRYLIICQWFLLLG